ncbi:MAG: hypothetical protein WC584_01555 [Candidatus Pacearchaeota archaeon]
MAKKKVTLSLDSKTYSDFQKYCNENAIIVSKRIEIFMRDFFNDIVKKKKIASLLFVFFTVLSLINFISASIIFSDGFESGTLNGWTLTKASGANDWTASTTNPFQGTYHAQSQPSSTTEPASVMQKTISTSGYSNIVLNYTRRLVGIDGVDEFQVEWYDGTSWAILEQTGDNPADDVDYISNQFSISAGANNNANFAIKFECTAGAVSEFCRVDNVNVTGDLTDNIPPTFSNYKENPTNGSVYTQGAFYEFNVTITESNLDKVGIEFNGVNYTGSNLRNLSNIYIFNRTNLGAGTYNYYWWANDSLGNYNTSGIRVYTINKSESQTSLTFDKNSPQIYGAQINATCKLISGVGSVVLYRNGINVNSDENGKLVTLGAATWNYNCSLVLSQNYSASENISSFTINQASTTTNISVFPTSPIIYGTASNFSCSNSQSLATTLYIDEINKNSEKGLNITRGTGTYNINCSATANQNYSGGFQQISYTINKATPTANLTNTTSWTISYGTSVTIGLSETNSGDGDLTYKIYRNNIDKGSGETVTLGFGNYNYILNTTGGQNYSSSNLDSQTLTVNKADPSNNLQIVVTPSSNVNYGTQTSATGSETNSGDSDLTYSFYRNNISIANPNTEILNAGTYNYIYNTTGGMNYTSGSVNTNLIVNKIGNAVSLLLNGGTNNLTLIYPQQVNASASSTSGVVNLFRNNTDVSLNNGQNTTLGVGFYEFFVNSSGNQNYLANITGVFRFVNITPEPDTQPPTTAIFSPLSATYSSNLSLELNYSVIDFNGVDSCWYNINFGTNISLPNCQNTTFNVSGGGTFTLYLYANDSLGNLERDSVTFFVDLIGINLSISQPSGTKSSRTGIPLTYSVTGNNLSCSYNVQTSIGGIVIANTSVSNCTSTTFDVSTDGDYILNLFATNILGTFKSTNSSFTISTSSGSSGGSTGTGGGGGGSTTIIQETNGTTELNVGEINGIVGNAGDTKKLSWKVKNSGTAFLNGCKFGSYGDYASWISASEMKNLAAGEESIFIFDVKIPGDAVDGNYLLGVSLNCQEINKSSSFNVEILKKKLYFELKKIERVSETQVKVSYSLEELFGINQNVNLQFLLFDSSNEKVAEMQEEKRISSNFKGDFETLINVDSSLEGELKLLVNMNSEEYSSFFQENVILGAPTGFAIFGQGSNDKIISFILIILFLLFAFFIIRRILSHRKQIRIREKVKVIKNSNKGKIIIIRKRKKRSD